MINNNDVNIGIYFARVNPVRYGHVLTGGVKELPHDPQNPSLELVAADKLAQKMRICNVKVKIPMGDRFMEKHIKWDLLDSKTMSAREYMLQYGPEFGLNLEQAGLIAREIDEQIDRHIEALRSGSTVRLNSRKGTKRSRGGFKIRAPVRNRAQNVIDTDLSGYSISEEEIQAFLKRKQESFKHLSHPARYWPNASCHICHNRKPHVFNNCHAAMNKHSFCHVHIEQRFGIKNPVKSLQENPKLWSECPVCVNRCICSACQVLLRKVLYQDRSQNPQFYKKIEKPDSSHSEQMKEDQKDEAKNDEIASVEKNCGEKTEKSDEKSAPIHSINQQTAEASKTFQDANNNSNDCSKIKEDLENFILSNPNANFQNKNIPYCIQCSDDENSDFLRCSNCPRTYHTICAGIEETEGKWWCRECLGEGQGKPVLNPNKGSNHITACSNLLLALKKSNLVTNFINPVTKNTFGDKQDEWERYLSLIPLEYHMDLSKIKRKLKAGEYGVKEDKGVLVYKFVRDIRQVWFNCLSFNPFGNSLYRFAALLNEASDKWINKYIKPLLSEDAAKAFEAVPIIRNCTWKIPESDKLTGKRLREDVDKIPDKDAKVGRMFKTRSKRKKG